MGCARSEARVSPAWLALSALACVGCTGDIGGEAARVPGPPVVEPAEVPANPELVASISSCAPRRAGEVLLSVSPEGHAWLLVAGTPNSLRVLDPFGQVMAEAIEPVEIADIASAQAWSGRDAALIAGDGLWTLEDLARIELTPPSGFATPASFCGDPRENGLLVSGGQVFERRGAAWWVWDPGLDGEGAPRAVLGYDGECQSTDDLTWLSAEDGTLYRLEPAQFSRPIRFDRLVDAATTQGMVAVMDGEQLWIGPDAWQSWVFPGAAPRELSASEGKLWLVSGEQLLRFDGSTFVEVAHTMSEPVEQIAAHASGVWLLGASTICHQAVGPMLRIEGIRPYARSTALEQLLRVKPSDESLQVSADLDGVPVQLSADAEGEWLEADLRFDALGWHHLSFTDANGSVLRSVAVKRLPDVERGWAADVAPIYEQSCTGSVCHRAGSTEPPDLGSYAAWTARADELRARVVEARTMPPPASIGPDWDDGDRTIIQEWLEGGRLP
jgi:hypothetical protein